LNQSRAFLVSFGFALLGMVLVGLYVYSQDQESKEKFGKLAAVLVASKNINEMQVLDESMVSQESIFDKFIQPGALTDFKDIKDMVALVPIKAGEQILVTKLSPKSTETGLAVQVSASKRAMSIPVNNESGVSKLIKPGDHVDVIGSISYPNPDGSKQTELKTLLQNVTILAVGEIIQNNIPTRYENDPLNQKKVAVSARGEKNFDTVTIEVTPEQSQVLIYALAQGTGLYLTLRNPIDRAENNIGSTTLDEVLGPDSKRAEAREREQRRAIEEARQAAAAAAAAAAAKNAPPEGTAPPAKKPASDPLEAGGGVFE
jgi:pilus assembly protein CpaB